MTSRTRLLLAVGGVLLAVVVVCELTVCLLTSELPMPRLPRLPKPAAVQAGPPPCCGKCHEGRD